MNSTRQDAWTPDEDLLLAETVLRYIREGKTQLEAFKEVAKKLSRTSAACGFRWNASIRKQYQQAVQLAKKERKQGEKDSVEEFEIYTRRPSELPLETAISLLEKMKASYYQDETSELKEHKIKQLQAETEDLKQQLKKYQDAWKEMGKLWSWVETSNSEKKPLDKSM